MKEKRALGLSLQIALGLTSILYAVAIAVEAVLDRAGVRPFPHVGSLPQRLVADIAPAALGIFFLVTRRRMTGERPWIALVFGLVLSTVLFFEYLRYFWSGLALLCVVGFTDTAVFAVRDAVRSRAWPNRLCAAVTCIWSALLVGYLAAGELVWRALPHVPRVEKVTTSPTAVSIADSSCEGMRRSLAAIDPALATTLAENLAALPSELGATYCRFVATHSQAILRSTPTVEALRAAIAFERFRLGAYLSSGVAPKCYRGFFDKKGNTAEAEIVLRKTVQAAVTTVNEFAERTGRAARLTEMDVAVTFIAEGGGWLLTIGTGDLDRSHPRRGIGLDDFGQGFVDLKDLVAELDQKLGTDLAHLSTSILGVHLLRRPMTFREAIEGTAVMLLWEKELAIQYAKREGFDLMTLPRDRQFVITSLVYNSGVFFPAERVDQLLRFATLDYLVSVNEANQGQRPPLPILAADEAKRRLIAGDPIPAQPTSWNAVYHVLQRYGAWVALDAEGSVFDSNGRFRNRE
jgi:hypothetical protein